MTDQDLDQSYSILCATMAEVGEAKTPLFLASLCLQLMSRLDHPQEVVPLMEAARVAALK